jgi:tRNA threonylcarbamoyladenosine biosynthesis protein TsaB
MLLLAFDTTSEHGGVGIFRDEKCLGVAANRQGTNYSVSLFQMAEEVLRAARGSLREIELFAVANGPGSFTGIRVGVAAAQGWAKALGRPVQGVSVLEAMTEAARPQTDWAAALLDARRGELYLGLFHRSDPCRSGAPAFQPHGPGWVLKPQALGAFLEQQLPAGASLTFLVRKHDAAAARVRATLPGRFAWQSLPGLLVEPIARLALAAHQLGRVQSPADLDARYLRRSDAELNWQE